MKAMKKILCAVLAVCLTAGLFLVQPADVKAATAPTATKSVQMYATGVTYSAIRVGYQSVGDRIKNLKTNSKNLIAIVTETHTAASSSSGYNPGYAYIGLRSKKAGTYKVSFDLYDKNNKKIKSFTTTVKTTTTYYTSGSPVKKATFAGKQYFSSQVTTKKSGKFAVTLNKGYTLKSIVVGTYDKNGKYTQKTVKNKSKITLGLYSSKSEYKSESEYSDYFYYSYSSGIRATTTITVTYQDKKTKETGTVSYNIYRIANDAVSKK